MVSVLSIQSDKEWASTIQLYRNHRDARNFNAPRCIFYVPIRDLTIGKQLEKAIGGIIGLRPCDGQARNMPHETLLFFLELRVMCGHAS